MIAWTEEILRKAAAWQAFKEGKSLLDSGMVVDVKAGGNGWQGTVRMGKRLMKVSVIVKSPTYLDTTCPCSDNQRSGSFCAHAVATGLATLKPAAPVKPVQTSVQKSAASPPAASVPWQILLPLNWREALARGKFAATLATAAGEEISPADDRLNAWLGKEGVAQKPILSLNLDGPRVPAFLESIAEHPRLAAGKDRLVIQIRSGERLQLISADHRGDQIHLVPDPAAGTWTEIGGSFWQITESSVTRVGEGSLPSDLATAFSDLARGKSVEIPIQRFFNHLDSWQEWLHFPEGSWLNQLHFIPANAHFNLLLEGSLQHLEAQLSVGYGNAEPVPPGLGKVNGLPRLIADQCEVRDLVKEEQAASRMMKAGFAVENFSSGRWVMKGEPAILDFLTKTLPRLRSEWTVTEGERFNHVQKQVAIVSPKIEILGSGEDWLSFDLSFQTTDGVSIPAGEVRRLLRAGAGTKQAGERRLIVSDDIANVIDPLFSDMDLRQENGRFIASARSGELIREIRNKINKAQNDNNGGDNFSFDFPATLRAELRAYQTHGAGWMHDRVRRFGGALLADDMGLGKTVQTIALIERLFQDGTNDSGVVMVVATASLLGNWRAEFGKFAPARKVRILHGAGRDAERERVQSGDVILTSYGTLPRDLAYHLKREYRAVVVDEASLMRNPDTDHAKAISKLSATSRVALTGTPIENGVKDLWSIFRFVQPGWLGSREDFKDRYEQPLLVGESSGAVIERLRLKISPFLLRRTKEEVAPELPSKLFIDEFCDLSPDQQGVYKELLVEGRKRVDAVADSGNKGAARMQMLTALLRLRQTCCDLALLKNDRFNQLLVPRRSAKLSRLLELIEEAVNGNHRMLVFSQFQTQLQEIEKCVSERGWDCLRLDGRTRNRQQLVDRFQQPDGPPVFLISLKAGGYGLNLTAADTVVHFDPWWNPAAEAQATDRAHRIGQTRPVTVYRLLTRGTVEEKVVRLQAKKRELASAIDENGTGDAAGWSMDELESMLG
ncbi:DEAD/DEAH box helicase family protein [Luteolibacter yonseiensis]|uniref:DEAD/DEAH box helicase family protein n=1 Tax=Luteolibacter yonseiensis TaxID=1144680 RepID=A0A934R8P4_9BACT|nr:DEAD/DEAH box helicase [Luteolibacter yonseiensis]MBK1818357.1 DEAD/DEAH box helicase family protein [Luteolibacter yonseiensis]